MGTISFPLLDKVTGKINPEFLPDGFGGGSISIVDNGDGTITLSDTGTGTSIVDNGDGTITLNP